MSRNLVDKILEKIYGSGLKFLPTASLADTCRLVVEEGMQLAGAHIGSILLLENKKLKRIYASSPIFYKIKPGKRDYMYKVLGGSDPVILKKTKIRSDIMLPLSDCRQPAGVITFMSSKPKAFTPKSINALKLFAPLAMLAIKKAQLNDESRKALDSRDQFISMAAHELKTPLTTINGYAQLLYSKLAQSDTAEARWAEELSWESNRLTQLTNELLEIDRIKSGKFRYVWEECYLKEIIDRALLDFRFTRPETQVVLKNKLIPGTDRIIGDYNKLLQAVINLLDNAAKFSPAGQKVTITLRRRLGYIILEIKDKGCGIAKKDLPRLFEIFYRGGERGTEGMGIGLFLAKNIINQHRGAIKIRSKELRGTSVEIRLPQHQN